MSKILVADANEFIRLAMRINLELEQHQVIEAQTGLEGLCQVEKEWPDVVVLDVMMPEMDGAQICEHLKGQPRTQSIPVLVFGALPREELFRRAPHADAFLEIPFDPTALVNAVNRLAN